MTHGTTALPVLDVGEAEAIKESMVMLRYFDERFPEPTVRQRDPYRHAIEGMLTAMEGDFCARGYLFVMNQDPARRDACLAHPAAQQVTREEIVKVYYDYAKGAGNGALLAGRRKSSFSFEPGWRSRPWPPKDKYAHSATDEELGLSQAPGR